MRKAALVIAAALLLFSCATEKKENAPEPIPEAGEILIQEEIPASIVETVPEPEPEISVEGAEAVESEEETSEESPDIEEESEEQELIETEKEPIVHTSQSEEEVIEEEDPEVLFLSRVDELEASLFLSLPLDFSTDDGDTITFSGGTSSVVLRDGREYVELTEGAVVTVGSMSLSADEISLSGSNWRFVECSGTVRVEDDERGISILTSSLWYDRKEERILVTSWFEIEDRTNEVTASGAVLEYRLDEERLQLDKDVLLLKADDDGLMRCRAESVIFSRKENSLSLRGSSSVTWKGNDYSAEVISVDLDTDTILLEGKIKGDIHG